MKLIKVLLKIVLCLVLIALVAVLTLPLWFGPVGKTVANIAVPKTLKTSFRLGQLSLNPYTGRFEIGDVQLYNPEGYSQQFAVTLGDLVVDAEPGSLVSDVIHVEEITVKDVFVSYVSGGAERVNNFKQIQYNIAGGREEFERTQAAKKEESAKTAPQKTAEADDKPAKKVVVDRFHLSGLVVQLGFLPLRLPVDITLKDIGKEANGVTMSEFWQQVWGEVLKASGVLGDQLKGMGGIFGDTSKKVSGAVGKATTGAMKAVGETTTAVTDAAAKTTEGATKAVGSATKAVGDGATKALESIKSLW